MSLPTYQGYIFDLDGVIWRRKALIEGADRTVSELRKRGAQLCFLTNNAGERRSTTHKKLVSMGVDAQLDEVITAGYATAQVLRRDFGLLKIFVMGSAELAEEMREAGHSVVTTNADGVVVGLDTEFNYQKLNAAFQCLRQGAKFVACNDNRIYPVEDGVHPGVGPSVRALACCAGREPDLVVGKPNLPIMKFALAALKVPANKCLCVGDQLEYDIQVGKNVGMDTALVLTGIAKEEDIEKMGIRPTFILNSIIDVVA